MKIATYVIIFGQLFNTALSYSVVQPVENTVKPIVQGNTAFAVDLYLQLRQEEGNLFFSPYSLSTALAMVYAGAKNQTAAQMAQTMHFDPNDDAFHRNYGRLIEQLNEQGEKENYKLLIANALWGQEDFRFLASYLDLTDKYYDARLELVNYLTAAEKARQTINAWVEDKTEDKIKNLIPQGALDASTRLVLTNAIYFKGTWAEQFDKKQTKPAPFYLNHTDTIQADLMHREGTYRYAEAVGFHYASGTKFQILELPYKGDELSMLVLLPEERGAGRMEANLSAEALKRWTSELASRTVDVYLPRFKLTSQFELNRTLGKMGMPLAFSQQAADFSGMTGKKDLFISRVIHKAYVDVNEEGTEAAAATGIMMLEGGYSIPEPPPVFRADRPFIFLIKDNATGSILFMGRVAHPTEENSKS